MANAGFGFIGFCLMVSWLTLLFGIAWRLRGLVKDRFEYISVAYFPLKAATMGWIFLWAFWWLVIGEVWWFVDADSTTIALLFTFFVDGLCRPAALAYVSLVWSLDLSNLVPLDVDDGTIAHGGPEGAIPQGQRDVGRARDMRHRAQPTMDDGRVSGSGGEHDGNFSDARNGSSDDDTRHHRGGTLHIYDREGAAPSGRFRMSASPVTPTLPPPQESSAARSGGMLAQALAYVGIARAFVLGEEEEVEQRASTDEAFHGVAVVAGGGARRVRAGQRPWELRARWRMVLRARWVVMLQLVWTGLFLGLTVWVSGKAAVACAILEEPESTGCYHLVVPNHVMLLRPRVFTVVALISQSVLFGALAVSGLAQYRRLGHLRGRQRFRGTLLRVLALHAVIVFSLWCRIFDKVRFNGAVVFFLLLDDVASQALLWTFIGHMRTAANRKASGRVPDGLRFAWRELVAIVRPVLMRAEAACRSAVAAVRSRCARDHRADEAPPAPPSSSSRTALPLSRRSLDAAVLTEQRHLDDDAAMSPRDASNDAFSPISRATSCPSTPHLHRTMQRRGSSGRQGSTVGAGGDTPRSPTADCVDDTAAAMVDGVVARQPVEPVRSVVDDATHARPSSANINGQTTMHGGSSTKLPDLPVSASSTLGVVAEEVENA